MKQEFPYSRFLSIYTPWLIPVALLLPFLGVVAITTSKLEQIVVLMAGVMVFVAAIPIARRQFLLAANGKVVIDENRVEIFERGALPLASFPLRSIQGFRMIGSNDDASVRGHWSAAWYELKTSEGGCRFLAHPKDDLIDILEGWSYQNTAGTREHDGKKAHAGF